MKTNRPLLLLATALSLAPGCASSLQAQNAALLNDLVSYWPMDELTGNKTPDKKSGYELTLQNVTATDFVAGKKGNALRFDRTRSMMASRISPLDEDLPVGKQASCTVAFWVVANSSGQNSLCFFAEGNPATDSPFTSIRTDNRVAGGQNACVLTAFRPTAGGNAIINRSAALPLDGVDWHHVALVQSDAGDGTAMRTLYIDGVEDLSSTGTGLPIKGAAETYSLTTTALGGLHRSTKSSYVSADLDEVAVWKRALSAAEIVDLRDNGLPAITPPPPPLVINSFSGDFTQVASGRPLTLSWDVSATGLITIDPAPGNVTPLSSFGVGKVVVTPTEDTIYTLTLTRGNEPPLTRTVSVTLLTDVAAGWDVLDTFQNRTPGVMGGQYPWLSSLWQVQAEGSTGNLIARTNPAESVIGLPLGSRGVEVGSKATLFSRFLIPTTGVADINLIFGLSDKTVRFGSDWLTNNGPVVRIFRTGGGNPQLQARNGELSEWQDAPLSLIPGTPYNIWIDIENVEGPADLFSVHLGAVGSARTTVFNGHLSDRRDVEVPFLGFPVPVLNSLVLATSVAAANAPVFQDDFFLSTGNAFNATEPVTSRLTYVAPPAPLEILETNFNVNNGDLLLRWSSVAGANYAIEKANDPTIDPWTVVDTVIPATGDSTQWLFSVPADERKLYFYRVRRLLP